MHLRRRHGPLSIILLRTACSVLSAVAALPPGPAAAQAEPEAKETTPEEPAAQWSPPPPEGGDAEAHEAPTQADADVQSNVPGTRLPQIAVIVLSGSIGRPFDGAVDRHLLANLTRHMQPVSMAAVHRAVVSVHGNARTLRTPPKLLEIGHELDVPFVLLIEAIGQPRATHVFAGLVDVKAGRTLMGHRQPIAHGNLDALSGRALANRLNAVVAEAWSHRKRARPPAEPLPSEEAPVPRADEPPPEEPAEEGATSKGSSDENAAEPAPHKKAHKPARHAETDLEGKPAMEPMLLPRGRIGAGFQLMQRVSHLKAADVSDLAPPCYCGTKNNAQPFFPALVLSGELATGAFTKQRARPQDSLGLRVDFLLAPVKTRVIQGTGTSSVSSLVLGLDANLFYRLAWFPHRALTPDIDFHVGVHSFSFPLKNTQYTSVAYLAPNLGIALDVPLRAQVGLFFGVDLRPGLTAGSAAKAALGKAKAGLAVAVDAGIRGGWRLLGLDLAFRYEHYQVGYRGTTNLPNMPTDTSGNTIQFSNVKLTDQLIGLMLRAHLAF